MNYSRLQVLDPNVLFRHFLTINVYWEEYSDSWRLLGGVWMNEWVKCLQNLESSNQFKEIEHKMSEYGTVYVKKCCNNCEIGTRTEEQQFKRCLYTTDVPQFRYTGGQKPRVPEIINPQSLCAHHEVEVANHLLSQQLKHKQEGYTGKEQLQVNAS